jgi:hypothetical protein
LADQQDTGATGPWNVATTVSPGGRRVRPVFDVRPKRLEELAGPATDLVDAGGVKRGRC